jgi:PPOX class probable F420-dependent enzyme
MQLDADVVRLAKGKNLATVVTLMPNGQPQALLTWVDTDGEHVLVNTEPQRQRARNIRRDPRITVLIHSADDPWDWAEVRGHVVETSPGSRPASTSTNCPTNTWAATTATRSARKAGSSSRSPRTRSTPRP